MASLKLFTLVVCLPVLTIAQLGLPTDSSGATIEDQFRNTQPLVYNNVRTKDGYHFSYETYDGSKREEEGKIVNPGTEQEELVVKGSYSYYEGNTMILTIYTADKNGFKVKVEYKFVAPLGVAFLPPKLLGSLAG